VPPRSPSTNFLDDCFSRTRTTGIPDSTEITEHQSTIPEVSLLPVLAAPGAVIRYTRATESPEPATLKLENLLPLLSSLSKGGPVFCGVKYPTQKFASGQRGTAMTYPPTYKDG
jgi:hypothetical protein